LPEDRVVSVTPVNIVVFDVAGIGVAVFVASYRCTS